MPLGCCDWLRWFEVPGSLFAFGHHFVRFAILTSVIGAPIASEVGALLERGWLFCGAVLWRGGPPRPTI